MRTCRRIGFFVRRTEMQRELRGPQVDCAGAVCSARPLIVHARKVSLTGRSAASFTV